MISAQARTRAALKTIRHLTRADGGRYLDYGIELRVVELDLDSGRELIPGLPPLRIVDRERIGGILDTVTRRLVGPTERPVVWYVGRRQREILLRRDPKRSRTLLYSAEGGGKTVLMAQWLIVQVLALLSAGEPGAIGATAPTSPRLDTLISAVVARIPTDTTVAPNPAAWARMYVDAGELRFASGHVIQFRSTKKQSGATGSPVQGYTWVASGDDELQDTAENGADPDIEARLRGARTSYRMCTATAKDSPAWRTFRDGKTSSPDWQIERLSYTETPFVWPDHWERMRRNVSEREWMRRGLAMDVGPERMTYTTWSREDNLRPIPQIGAVDVTAEVMRPWGPNIHVLVGHDPGSLWDVSVFLKAYRLVGERRHRWWVVGELTTARSTTEQHVLALLDKVRREWGCNDLDWRGMRDADAPRVLVRADPYSDSGSDASHPHRSVYTVFRQHGLTILPAALRATTSAVKPSPVPKQAGIDMVVSLLASASGERRLLIACDQNRAPAAPRLVEALEMSELDAEGRAETAKKDARDLSHWCAALRYALWALECPRIREVA